MASGAILVNISWFNPSYFCENIGSKSVLSTVAGWNSSILIIPVIHVLVSNLYGISAPKNCSSWHVVQQKSVNAVFFYFMRVGKSQFNFEMSSMKAQLRSICLRCTLKVVLLVFKEMDHCCVVCCIAETNLI
jgi:hypothetical protein